MRCTAEAAVAAAGRIALALVLTVALALPALPARAAGTYRVEPERVQDYKAVFATVESTDVVAARARNQGTVAALNVDEGSRVEAGEVIARVEDPKLQRQKAAAEAKIDALKAEKELARVSLDRARELRESGAASQARLDEARTQLRVARRNLAAQRAELNVIERRIEEGKVRAPQAGRVMKVKVTDGVVIRPGEVVARIAAAARFLRIRVPERHARFLDTGDPVLVGRRGVGEREGGARAATREGTVSLVYPEIENGRVVADIKVDGLGDYLIGERTRVWVGTGTRRTFVVPRAYLIRRYGVTYARLEGGQDVVVQPGRRRDGGVEVLSGLKPGDVLVKP